MSFPCFVLQCNHCGETVAAGARTCPNDDGVLFAKYRLPEVASIDALIDLSKPGIWKFSAVLPNVSEPISFEEGGTPLLRSRWLGPKLGIQLHIKDEGRNPSGSFKDRAASLLISMEKQSGGAASATATSGNAGGALALYAAIAKHPMYLFVFRPTREKLLHMKSFGATLFMIESDRESDMTRLTEEACAAFGWSSLTTMASANPFNVEGYKTIAYEIAHDIGVPDVMVAPMGSGTLMLGLSKGFGELHEMGLISRIPRLIGVQAEQVNPIARAFAAGSDVIQPVASSETIASGLVLDDPGICGAEALRAVRESEGAMVSVSEEDILAMTRHLPIEEGVFAEPSGAAAIAGVELARRDGIISAGEKVVCINSASRFKDLGADEVCKQDPSIVHIEPSLDAVRAFLQRQ